MSAATSGANNCPPSTLKRCGFAAVAVSDEARQQAQAEKLTLRVLAKNKTGYFGVHLNKPGVPKPYQAQVKRGGKSAHLGRFATAAKPQRLSVDGGQLFAPEVAALMSPLGQG